MKRTILTAALGCLLACSLVTGAFAADGVTLHDPGSDRHTSLAYDLREGAVMRFAMRQSTSVDTILRGQRSPAAIPTMQVAYECRVLEVSTAGEARCEFEILDTKVVLDDGALTAAPAANEVIGTTGTLTLDRQGAVRKTPAPTSGQATVAAKSAEAGLCQLIIALPVEPVGIGARWSFRREANPDGMNLTEEVTCVLREREGDQLKLDVRIEQRGGAQDVKPGRFRVSEIQGLTHGTCTIELTRPLPTAVAYLNEVGTKGEVKIGDAWEPITTSLRGALDVGAWNAEATTASGSSDAP